MLKKSQLFCLGVLAVAYYYNITFSQQIEEGPVVSTRLGRIRGVTSYSRGGRKFYSYLGMPYAKPPVRNLRFEPPQPADKWEGIRDGSVFGARCMQMDLLLDVLAGDENCLFINVFTPVEQANPRVKPLPVLVYFHGGFFHNGGSDFWKPNYFMDEDVIFVSLNFRLAALGFLNSGDKEIRGNMGLKDQTMALRFVQDNIEFFGGDPERVTLLGESAGGVCSHLHMFSPMSKGLFNNVVSQSGSGLHFWAINQEPKQQAERFSELLGCPSNNTMLMKECLKKLDAGKITEVHRELQDPLRAAITIFKPSLEADIKDGNTFLSEHPTELAKRGAFTKVPWVTGVNSEEGLILSAAMLVNKTMETVAQKDWRHFLSRTIWHSTPGNTAEKIKKFYFGGGRSREFNENGNQTEVSIDTPINMDPYDRIECYTNMVSDRGFFYDTHHGAVLQSQHAPTYLYYYSYRGEWSVVNFYPEFTGPFSRQLIVGWLLASTWFTKNVLKRNLPNYGVSHSDELALMFYMPWISEIYTEDTDYEMSIDLIKLWVEFAQDDSRLRFRNVEWPLVNSSKTLPLQYMRLDNDAMVIDEPFSKGIEFWNNLSPE